MSATVRSISVGIDGIRSEKFDILLDGIKYRLDNFVLSESLLSPAELSFTLNKSPEESPQETQFSVCRDIIGRDIDLTLETAHTENESFNRQDQITSDIVFKGIILSANGSRCRGEYVINVCARSHDALLEDNVSCKSFENMTLEQIVSDVIDDYSECLSTEISPRFSEPIPYCVQYNETNYSFLTRLATRYGEWMYHDGEKFIFGILPEAQSVRLNYQHNDVPSYSVNLNMRHLAFSHLASSYNINDSTVKKGLEESEKNYNDLSDAVYYASVERFSKSTLRNLHSGGYADSDSRQTVLDVSTKTQARGEKAEMLKYSGTTYSSALKVGSTLVIVDNYLTKLQGISKSDMDQDEILVTDIIHYFNSEEEYSNTFSGISSACDYPPYSDSDVYPMASSCRAKVTDNEDPNNLGRIRVQFDWQAQQDQSMMTPWLRLSQPYAGGGKGFSFIPEIGEEVMIDFEGGNAERPYVKGTLYNGVGNPDGKWVPNGNSSNQIKAIRTRNGHTIEIHDKGSDGYIRIYDNGKENYILTFSTDQKLIKLESTGNIELYAQNDIIMHAGHDIKASADNDIFIAARHDMQRTADNDIREHAGNDRATSIDRNDSLTVESNQIIKVNDNKDEQVVHKTQLTAESIRIEAKEQLMEYSKTHHQKASDEMSMNAGNTINIKASTVKTN